MLWHSKVFFPFISYHFIVEKLKPSLLFMSMANPIFLFFSFTLYFSREISLWQSISFRTRYLPVLLFTILLKILCSMIRVEPQRFCKLEIKQIISLSENQRLAMFEESIEITALKHEQQPSAWKLCRWGAHTSNWSVWKPIRYITYPFQDCGTAIGIRYENHAKIIMF